MPSPRTLISLPSDVLHEILAHLLLDTPRDRNRAAVLRTCSLLHELGLPLLYRVVDLEGALDSPERWNNLFGVGGVLAKGRTVEVGSFVRELKLDELLKLQSQKPKREFGTYPSEDGGDHNLANVKTYLLPRLYFYKDLHVSQLALHRCSSLTLPIVNDEDFPAVAKIVSQIPLTNVVFFENPAYGLGVTKFPDDSYSARLSDRVGLHPQPLAWKKLERLTMRNILWWEFVGTARRRLSFSDWTFKVLVFEADPLFAEDAERAFALFLEPVHVMSEMEQTEEDEKRRRDGEEFLPNVERIELRIGGGCAKEIEQKFRDDVARRKARGLDELEERLLPMMLFIGEDGKERRMLEE